MHDAPFIPAISELSIHIGRDVEFVGSSGLLFAILCAQMTLRGLRQFRNGETLIPLLGLQYLLGAQFSGNLNQSAAMWIVMAMIFSHGKRMSFVTVAERLNGQSKINSAN